MIRLLPFFLASSLLVLSACQQQGLTTETENLCTEAWYQTVESTIPSGDGLGHGPDIGSDEWQSVIEFRLGVRGNPEVPARNTQEWCRYIDDFM